MVSQQRVERKWTGELLRGYNITDCQLPAILLRPRKINGLFLVQNFSKLDARTRKNYKTDKKIGLLSFSLVSPGFWAKRTRARTKNRPFILRGLMILKKQIAQQHMFYGLRTTLAWTTRLIIDHKALAKQRDNVLGSICPFVCVFVCLFACLRSHGFQSVLFKVKSQTFGAQVQQLILRRTNSNNCLQVWSKNGYYQSKIFVCICNLGA